MRIAICIGIKKRGFHLTESIRFFNIDFPSFIKYIRTFLSILSRFLHTECKNSERFHRIFPVYIVFFPL